MTKWILLPALGMLGGLLSHSAYAYQLTGQAASPNDGSGGNPASYNFSSPIPAATVSGSAAVSGSDNNPLAPKSGSASANSDLTDASVGAAASSNAGNVFGIPYTGSSSSFALITETLTFSLPGAASIGFLADLNGSSSIADLAASYNNSYAVTISSGANTGTFTHTASVAGDGTSTIANQALLNGVPWAGAMINGTTAEAANFLGYLTINPASPTVTIQELLSVDALGATNSQFGFLRLQLPAGVTFTSSSGAFLSAPVPEPGSFALLATAMIGLGVAGLAARPRLIRFVA